MEFCIFLFFFDLDLCSTTRRFVFFLVVSLRGSEARSRCYATHKETLRNGFMFKKKICLLGGGERWTWASGWTWEKREKRCVV